MVPGPEQVQISDAELVRAIARGDEQAFASLYRRYSSTLLGFLIRILDSLPEAEDVLQEVFVHVWQRAADFDETRGRVFTWLATIARSRAVDRMRAKGTRSRLEGEASLERQGDVADAVDDAIKTEQREVLLDALDTIPEGQRDALLLAYFEGLSQSEIAERTGTPLGTVKTRTREGLRKLRDLLRKKMKGKLSE
ncbi:MAG TPA: sigma-70 family RNA polymerase sigma factor [Pyrinomonadaceae bacterium]